MILDVGCGGNYSVGTGKQNEDGFRPSELKSDVQIDLRKPKVKPANFVLASAEKLPFKEKMFDLAQSFDVIEHVDAPVYMVAEMHRVAKNILLVTPNSLHLPSILMSIVRKNCRYDPHGDHISVWSKAEMEGLFNRAGSKDHVVGFTNFHNHKAHWYVRFLMMFVPFPALKYRALMVTTHKKPKPQSSFHSALERLLDEEKVY